MSKTISWKLRNKIYSMYSLRYETKNYEYRIDYWGDILRRSRKSCWDCWERFTYDAKAHNYKLVVE